MASAGEVWSPSRAEDQYTWDSQMRLLAAVHEQHSLQQQQAAHQAAHQGVDLEGGGDPSPGPGPGAGAHDDSGIQGVSVVDHTYSYAGVAVPSYVPTVIDTPEPKAGEGGCIYCQVEGCQKDIREEKEYYQRYRICEEHLKLGSLMKDDKLQRFCQQCGRFHELSAFDGDKRSCRARLQLHNNRRRKRSKQPTAASAAAASGGGSDSDADWDVSMEGPAAPRARRTRSRKKQSPPLTVARSSAYQPPASAAHTFSAPDLRDVRRRVGYRGDGDPAGGGLLQLGGAGAETMAGRAAEAGLPNEFAAFLAQQRRLAGVPFSGLDQPQQLALPSSRRHGAIMAEAADFKAASDPALPAAAATARASLDSAEHNWGFAAQESAELSQSARDVDWLRAQHVQQISQGTWRPAFGRQDLHRASAPVPDYRLHSSFEREGHSPEYFQRIWPSQWSTGGAQGWAAQQGSQLRSYASAEPFQRLSSGQPFNRIASLDVPPRRFGSAEFDLQPGLDPLAGGLGSYDQRPHVSYGPPQLRARGPQNGNSFATMSMPARAAGHGNTTPRQGSSSYPPDRDARATPGSGPGLDRLSPLMSAPPGFSVEAMSPRHGLRRTSVGASPLGSRQGSYSINQGPLFDAAIASAVHAAAAASGGSASSAGGNSGGGMQQQQLPTMPRRGSVELALPLPPQSRPSNPFAGPAPPMPEAAFNRRRSGEGAVAGFAAMREASWPQPPRQQQQQQHEGRDLGLHLQPAQPQQQLPHQMQAQHAGFEGSPRVVPSPFSRASEYLGPHTIAPQSMALPLLTLGLEPDSHGSRQQPGSVGGRPRVDLNTALPPQQLLMPHEGPAPAPMPATAPPQQQTDLRREARSSPGGQQEGSPANGGTVPAELALLSSPSAEQRQTGDWLRAAGWGRGPAPAVSPSQEALSGGGGGPRTSPQPNSAASPLLTQARPSHTYPAGALGSLSSPTDATTPDASAAGGGAATPTAASLSTPPQPGPVPGGGAGGGSRGGADSAATSSPEFSERLRQMSLQYYKIEPASLPPELQSSLLEVLQVDAAGSGPLQVEPLAPSSEGHDGRLF